MNNDSPNRFPDQEILLFTSPEPAGHIETWEGSFFTAKKKPNLLHRIMMRWLLGWKWHDATSTENNDE